MREIVFIKILKRAKQYAAIELTLTLSFVMGIKAVPVHAEEESERIEGVQSEINIISTNRVIDYQVILQDRYGDTTILKSCTNVSLTIK